MIVKCSYCGYNWDYQGKSPLFATCPSCQRKTKIWIKENLKYATILKCAHCGNDFVKKRKESKYCHSLCQKRAASILGGKVTKEKCDFNGDRNPNWKGGIAKNNYHYKKLQKERYPERIKCREILAKAVASGKIKKPEKCEFCKKKRKLHGHHDDYSKPLDVNWLCRTCHSQTKHNGSF